MQPNNRGLTGRELLFIAASRVGDHAMIEVDAVGERGQWRSRQVCGTKHGLLLGGAVQPAELGHQLAHGAHAPAIGVVGDVAGDEPFRCAAVYQWGEVGSDGFHFAHAGSVAGTVERSPNQSVVRVRCGLSQGY